ncbi:MAG: Spy/CpxP family protein refolding chaperone [Planctomycetota bacterium]|nr:Spy/CpxP family protein refolding chaperone [Planctomycetota bacterium]
MSRWLGVMLLVGACVCWTASVIAGQPGGGPGGGHGPGGGEKPGGPGAMLPPPPPAVLFFIMDHADDLKLTDEQKQKLAELRKLLPPPSEKPAVPDPALKALFEKLHEAMKSGDKEAAAKVREEMAEKMKQLHPEGEKVMEGIKGILTQEQLAQVKELMKSAPKGGEGRGPGGKHGGPKGGGGPPEGAK